MHNLNELLGVLAIHYITKLKLNEELKLKEELKLNKELKLNEELN